MLVEIVAVPKGADVDDNVNAFSANVCMHTNLLANSLELCSIDWSEIAHVQDSSRFLTHYHE